MRKALPLVVISIFILLLSSCELINPAEEIPSFIKIDTFTLSTLPGEGTASHKIKDVWLTIDDEVIGAFELPAHIPVLKSGEQHMVVSPGIFVNGISATRAIYPFYKPMEIDRELFLDSTIQLQGAITYESNLEFVWNSRGEEDFEEGGVSLISDASSDTSLFKVTGADVFEGNYSGMVSLDTNNSYYLGLSTENFVLPSANSPILLELNYKNNNHFSVGIFSYGTGQRVGSELIILKPQENWNKIYINLTAAVSRNWTAGYHKVFFEVVREDSLEQAEVYFDNIKLIHF